MDDTQLTNRVLDILAIVLEVDRSDVSLETTMDMIEAWDSLKHMKLVMALEQELGIEFDDEDVVEMLSVQLIVISAKEKLAG